MISVRDVLLAGSHDNERTARRKVVREKRTDKRKRTAAEETSVWFHDSGTFCTDNAHSSAQLRRRVVGLRKAEKDTEVRTVIS